MSGAAGDAASATGNGFLILDKAPGISSRHALAHASKTLGARKAGHAGTLDPFASGVLVCLFGRYTRLSDWFMAGTKGYDASICFGSETDTLDPEGLVIARAALPTLTQLEQSLAAFRGQIQQVPPAHSAIHVNGKRSYELARKGQEVELAPRSVFIHELTLADYSNGTALVRVGCGKGTYIRSLARDIALACGSRAYLSALRRTAVGPFTIQHACTINDIHAKSLQRFTKADATGLGLSILELGDSDSDAFALGLPLARIGAFTDEHAIEGPVAVFDSSAVFAGIAVRDAGTWRYAMSMGGDT